MTTTFNFLPGVNSIVSGELMWVEWGLKKKWTMNNNRNSSNESNASSSMTGLRVNSWDFASSHPFSESGSSKSVFIRTIIPFLLLQFSVGLCSSLQATFYPIEASSKGATASEFGAVFGIIHLSLFMFGNVTVARQIFYVHWHFSQL